MSHGAGKEDLQPGLGLKAGVQGNRKPGQERGECKADVISHRMSAFGLRGNKLGPSLLGSSVGTKSSVIAATNSRFGTTAMARHLVGGSGASRALRGFKGRAIGECQRADP